MDIKITLSAGDVVAFSLIAVDPQAYVENFVRERLRVTKEEYGMMEARRRFAAGITVSGEMTLDELLAAAIESGVAVPLQKPE